MSMRWVGNMSDPEYPVFEADRDGILLLTSVLPRPFMCMRSGLVTNDPNKLVIEPGTGYPVFPEYSFGDRAVILEGPSVPA